MTLSRAIYVIFIAIILIGGFISYNYFWEAEQKPVVPKVWRVGLLLGDKDILSANLKGFTDGMEKAGYVGGKNIEYVERNYGSDRGAILDGFSKEMNEMGLDLIINGSSSATKSLRKLPDLKTPVFFLTAGLPLELVDDLQKPVLITGIGEPSAEFAGRRLEILKEIKPSIKKVISIVEKGHPTGNRFRVKLEEAAKELGIEVVYIEIGKSNEILQKLPLLNLSLGDAYIACTCQSNERYAKELAAALRKAKLPSINPETAIGANVGFLATHSNDRYKTGLRAADKVIKILNGTPVSEMPVEFATDLVLELNLKTAEMIGIEVPKSVISRADKTYNE